MYIPEFILGIASTVFAEMAALILLALWLNHKKRGRK